MKALRYVFVLAICFAMLPLQAQTRITGKVLDKSNNEALPYVTVRILAADSTIVAGAIGGDDGSFALSVETPGSYLLSLGFYGWLPYYQTIEVTGAELSLGSLYMLPDTVTMLDAVEITAKAPLIEQKMDKLVMNVSQSAFAQGNNAFELLRKAPGVSIDKDGNVLLNGQAVEVWIDGRPSHLDGKSLEALLRGTDGNSINKIEIIANPSAKYDAQGQGGIIDIKSKHTFAQGFNGSLSANAGGMGFGRNLELLGPDKAFYFTQDVNLNLNYRTTKTNTFLQLSESTMPMGVDVDNTTTSEHFTQMAQSYYDAQISSRTLKLGNDWFIDDKNTLGFIFTMPMSSMFQEADTDCNRSPPQASKSSRPTTSAVWSSSAAASPLPRCLWAKLSRFFSALEPTMSATPHPQHPASWWACPTRMSPTRASRSSAPSMAASHGTFPRIGNCSSMSRPPRLSLRAISTSQAASLAASA